MSLSIYLFIALWAGLFVVLPLLLLAFMKNGKAKTAFMGILLFLYLALIFVCVWGNINITSTTVNISFDFTHFVGGKQIFWAFENLTRNDIIINLAMLIPLGLILSYFFKHLSVVKSVLICWYLGFACGFILELSQYLMPIDRVVQLSDAIFNMISLFAGGLIGRLFIGISNKLYKGK